MDDIKTLFKAGLYTFTHHAGKDEKKHKDFNTLSNYNRDTGGDDLHCFNLSGHVMHRGSSVYLNSDYISIWLNLDFKE